MTAKYTGYCCRCKEDVSPGDRISWNNDGSHMVMHSVVCPSKGGIIVGSNSPNSITSKSLVEQSANSYFQKAKEAREFLGDK